MKVTFIVGSVQTISCKDGGIQVTMINPKATPFEIKDLVEWFWDEIIAEQKTTLKITLQALGVEE